MVKLKDIATIQTGVYLKSTPSPDTCYLQVNDFDEEGNIRPTVRPTTTVSSKAARHLLTESDLLLAAKGGKNFCAIAPTQLGPCVASPSFLIIRIDDPTRILSEYLCGFLNLPSTRQLLTAQAQGSAITRSARLTSRSSRYRSPRWSDSVLHRPHPPASPRTGPLQGHRGAPPANHRL